MLINIWYKEGGEPAHYRTRGGEWRGRERLTRIFIWSRSSEKAATNGAGSSPKTYLLEITRIKPDDQSLPELQKKKNGGMKCSKYSAKTAVG